LVFVCEFQFADPNIYFVCVDTISTLAIMTVDEYHRPGVTVELNTTYCRPLPLGSKIYITSRVLKSGKQLATAEINFYDQFWNFAAQSRHTKLLSPLPGEGPKL
jgi:uncharacterized protein (TIGR00369 family)